MSRQPTCLSRGDEIRYSLIPYTLKTPVADSITTHPHDSILGYVIYSKESGMRKFYYVDAGRATEAFDHWSLILLKEFPYLEQECDWIVYACHPRKINQSFNNFLECMALHVRDWDVWSVPGKTSHIAVVTDREWY